MIDIILFELISRYDLSAVISQSHLQVLAVVHILTNGIQLAKAVN